MDLALQGDLYQARMLLGYYFAGMHNRQAIMEAWARKLPKNRSFLVVAGLNRILNYLNEVKITDDTIDFWEEIFPEITFDDTLSDYLKSLDFSTLEVNAMLEGEVAFQNEPLIQIKGPIGMVQFVETAILSILNHDVRVASKAVRVCLAAGEKPVLEFGSRRTHDLAAIDAARAAFIGGCSGTSNMAAGAKYGVPVSGTQGHVWIQSFAEEGEEQAFKVWGDIFHDSVYLVDTYNTINAVDSIRKMSNEQGNQIKAIRLDSGNLEFLAKKARYIFDYPETVRNPYNPPPTTSIKIVASDDLNEYKIDNLLGEKAPIDMFGVGTEIVSTPDSPSCGIIYKLVSIQNENGDWLNVAKFSSEGKKTLAGAKQVYRYPEFEFDLITLKDELGYTTESFKPLLNYKLDPKFAPKSRANLKMNIKFAQARLKENLERMPEKLKDLYTQEPYNVHLSNKLKETTKKAKERNS